MPRFDSLFCSSGSAYIVEIYQVIQPGYSPTRLLQFGMLIHNTRVRQVFRNLPRQPQCNQRRYDRCPENRIAGSGSILSGSCYLQGKQQAVTNREQQKRIDTCAGSVLAICSRYIA